MNALYPVYYIFQLLALWVRDWTLSWSREMPSTGSKQASTDHITATHGHLILPAPQRFQPPRGHQRYSSVSIGG